jgi:Glu-tRNA(Gln) amidotransferase subunit E-like FAD-binding protein
MVHPMRDMSAIKKVVLKTLSGQFDNVRIVDVKVYEDVDHAAEEIVLRIHVIFEGIPRDLDARKLSGAVRHLRPKLEEINETALPLLSFISKAEASRNKRASA